MRVGLRGWKDKIEDEDRDADEMKEGDAGDREQREYRVKRWTEGGVQGLEDGKRERNR